MINCPVCLHEYDTKIRVPKIFPSCGHSICQNCLIQVLKMKYPQCPLDKMRFGNSFRTVDAFPINFLGKDLLEISNLWSKCQTHHEPNKMICLTDKILVCADCALFGDHKGHHIQLLSDVKNTAQKKKEELKVLSDAVLNQFNQLKSSFKQKQQSMRDSIHQSFQKLHATIHRQQTEMLLRLDTIFAEEKIELKNFMRKSSHLSLDIQKKLKEFSDMTSLPNLTKLFTEDLSDLKKNVEGNRIATEIQQINQLSELLVVLQNSLPKEDLFKDLNLVEPFNQQLAELNCNKEQLKDVINLSAELNIQLLREASLLHIESSPRKISYALRKSDLERVSRVCYRLKLSDETHVNSILPCIIVLSKYLANAKSIKILIDSNSQSISHENCFYSLILSSFSQPENLRNISFDASHIAVKDSGSLYLLNNVLPRIKDIEKFDLKLNKTQITSAVLRALTKTNFKAMPSLKTFKLDLSGTALNEEDIADFLLTVPNVNELSLQLGETSLTDKALENFSTDILPGLDRIADLKIGFSGTKITDIGVEKFMENLPNISHFEIILNSLRIKDSSLQHFFEKKVSSLTNLKKMKIGAERTFISREMKDKIECWNPNGQIFALQNNKPSQFKNLFSNLPGLPHNSPFSQQQQQQPSLFTSPPSSLSSSQKTSNPIIKSSKPRAFN